MMKSIDLKTKLIAKVSGREVGAYSCYIMMKDCRWLFTIDACEGTCGKWTWFLSSLLANNSDILSLEYDQDWYVENMKSALLEAVTYI